ncbi:prealbumin-like fold domain-containing protein [Lacticaseibacillus nasuensis]|uniref:Uncharacterized protein n=1 Tax=Lacticaseibacillus nasuensis JCM 17158 TaxID=1291734 RepID=A0A0R1JPF1_9LACO|nr:prealbumin-like fold domain-containing protein [Lacticaseibacillus nasuensis]KRK71027.1 hypothetical protein FD02_GL000211 [Lacticaseibacillus nasuensis JCM 17158]
MRKWLVLMAALIALAVSAATQPVHAAGNGTLTIEKRVSVKSAASTQQTRPLAGARYELTRIHAIAGPITATDAHTYRTLTGPAAYHVVVNTDANGEATITGLAIGADYLLRELPGAGVKTPAAPVLIRFSPTRTRYTYTPKSGLLESAPVLPDTKQPAKIVQTGGQLRWPLGLVAAVMLGGLVVAFGLTMRTRQEG